MIITHPMIPAITELTPKYAFAITAHGVIALLFVFAPFFIVVFRELKIINDGKNTDYSASSSFTFIIVAALAIALSNLLYFTIVYVLDNAILTTYAPISGSNGLTRIFWTITVNEGVSNNLPLDVINWIKAIEIIRLVIPFLCMLTKLTLLIFAFKAISLNLNMYEKEMGNGTKNVVGFLLCAITAVFVQAMVFTYYSDSTSSILNSASTIESIMNIWFKEMHILGFN